MIPLFKAFFTDNASIIHLTIIAFIGDVSSSEDFATGAFINRISSTDFFMQIFNNIFDIKIITISIITIIIIIFALLIRENQKLELL